MINEDFFPPALDCDRRQAKVRVENNLGVRSNLIHVVKIPLNEEDGEARVGNNHADYLLLEAAEVLRHNTPSWTLLLHAHLAEVVLLIELL